MWPLSWSLESGGQEPGARWRGRVVCGRCRGRWTPGGGLLAAGGGSGVGVCMALAAIVALAWLLLLVEVLVGSAGPRCRCCDPPLYLQLMETSNEALGHLS